MFQRRRVSYTVDRKVVCSQSCCETWSLMVHRVVLVDVICASAADVEWVTRSCTLSVIGVGPAGGAGGGSRRHPSSRVFPKKKMTAQSPPHPFLFFYLSRPSSFRFSPILGHRTPPMASPNPVMGSTAPTAGPGRARPLNNFCRILRQKVRFWWQQHLTFSKAFCQTENTIFEKNSSDINQRKRCVTVVIWL